MTDTFDTFWSDYPRKRCKEAARKAYAKAVKLDGAQTILDSLHAWNRVRKPCDPQFIPHASTWLNQRRYMDDHEAVAEKSLAAPMPEITVAGRVYRMSDLLSIRYRVRARQSIDRAEWDAIKAWQERGNWPDLRLPDRPRPLPSPEERAAKIQELKQRGLL